MKWRTDKNSSKYNTEKIVVCIDTVESKSKKDQYWLDVRECETEASLETENEQKTNGLDKATKAAAFFAST